MDNDESLEDAISSIIGDNYDFLDEKSDCNDYELNYETESVKGEGNLLVTDVVRSWTDIRNPRCEFLIWDSESGEPDPFANFDFSNPDKEALTR